MYYFFFNDTATTEIYTLSLHDALPISDRAGALRAVCRRAGQAAQETHGLGPTGAAAGRPLAAGAARRGGGRQQRSEEHTSELQSRQYLVCRLLLEKKKTNSIYSSFIYI